MMELLFRGYKKILLIVLVVMLAFPTAWAGTCWDGGYSGTAPWTASSAAYSDVNYCVNTVAAAGDTVNIPAGSASWTSTLTISESIIIQGATTCSSSQPITCTDNTTLSISSSDPIIRITTTSDKTINISGITFSGGSYHIAFSNSKTAPILYNLRISHNHFKNATGKAIYYDDNSGFVFGLLDHNRFTGNNNDLSVGGPDTTAEFTDYPISTAAGTKDYLFIEDNFFSGEKDYLLFNAGYGSRFVFRYNRIDETGWGSIDKVLDVHGAYVQYNNYGAEGSEIYNNTIVNASYYPYFASIRGGYSLIYNNVSNYRQQIRWWVDSDNSSPCSYTVCDGYAWNNRTNAGVIWNSELSDSNSCISENTTFWDDMAASTGGETPSSSDPIGHGNFWYDTHAKRPSTCTVNGSYWETDTNTLYRCTATDTWTEQYFPYPYPHPLSDSASVTIADSNPKSVDSDTTDVTISHNISPTPTCKWRLASAPDASNGTEFSGTNPTITGLSEGENTLYIGCDGPSNEYSWSVNDSLTINRGAAATTGKIPTTSINAGSVTMLNVNNGNVAVTAVY